MALLYDFDMVPITPEGLPAPFDDIDGANTAPVKVAMFRDPDVVAALRSADPVVRTFFIESGFAMQVHDNGAPPGRFAMRDEDARVTVIEKLSANLATHNLDGANWGGFSFPDFMECLSAAAPIEDVLLAPTRFGSGNAGELAAAQLASRQRTQRRMIAVSGLVLGLILILYVASQVIL